MNLLFLLVFLQTFSIFSTYNFTAEYSKLKKNLSCPSECFFDQPEITLETMGRWPSTCSRVCAILTLNENCDVPAENLTTLFKKLYLLNGGLRIENTSFTSLSFLPKMENFCQLFGTSIVNNSQLENVDSLIEMLQWGSCLFQLSNNSKLDATSLCESENYKNYIGLSIFGNKVDCGCPGGKMTSNSFENFVNCEGIRGNLMITDLNDPMVHLKMKKITGDLEVKKTNLTSLSFLGSLLEIRSFSHVSNKRVIINIHDNYQMTSLGLSSLKNLTNIQYGDFMMNFQNLHPDFCVTLDEMRMFLANNVQFTNLEARYCKYNDTSIDGPKLCVFEKMSSLESDCEHILGEILIESGDEDYVDKLDMVTHVFGSITIRNTELENCKFLKKLQRIASLNDTLPAMQFLNNTRLEKLALPNIQNFVARVNRVTIEGNSPGIFEKTTECMTIQYKGQTNITYNGGTCKAVNKTRVNSVVPYDDEYGEDVDKGWYYEYEGPLYDFDMTEYEPLLDTLFEVNDYIAVVGFIFNVFHLIVLLQKELRGNFIYIMMIGICLCDILLVSSFIIEFVLESGFVYTKSSCGYRNYYHVVAQVLETPTQTVTRRCSSLLALIMATFRTCSVMFPMSSTVTSFSKPKVALSLPIGFFLLCSVWDYSLVIDCKITVADNEMCEYGEYTAYTYGCPGFVGPSDHDDEDDIHIKWYRVVNLVNGFSTVIIGLLYIVITILLLTQLRSAKKRRKSLKSSEQSDNTSLLVTVMAITFFLSGFIYGLMFIADEFIIKYYWILQYIRKRTEVATWTLLTINSTIHCLICFFMSSQYRETAKRVFWRRGKESSGKSAIAVDLATVSSVKTSKSSSKRPL